ncbi:MAG TPA: dihydrofolate reductase, partial [Candidatus Ligilactobacillus excrementigallinarum]|nr:dihydrofolate reductase [Candidatus Ligilactobacillus excrementigallinarum]
MISYIWAEDINGGIGIDGHLPWHLSEDLKRFKNLTMNHTIIMGRKTYESLPGILPGRKHLVLSHQKLDVPNKVIVLNTKEQLDEWLKKHADEENIIIGGATLFKLYMNKVDVLYLTKIEKQYRTDTQMPQIDYSKFNLIDQSKHYENDVEFYFKTFNRK